MIYDRCLENITQPKQLMLNGDPVASGWNPKELIQTHHFLDDMIQCYTTCTCSCDDSDDAITLSLYFFLEISSKVHPPSSTSHLMIISCWCLMVLYGFCVVVHPCLAKQS